MTNASFDVRRFVHHRPIAQTRDSPPPTLRRARRGRGWRGAGIAAPELRRTRQRNADRYFRRTQSDETVFDSRFAHVDRQSSAKLAGTPRRYAFVVIGVLGGTPHSSPAHAHASCVQVCHRKLTQDVLSLSHRRIRRRGPRKGARRPRSPSDHHRGRKSELVTASLADAARRRDRTDSAPPRSLATRVPSILPQRPTREQGLRVARPAASSARRFRAKRLFRGPASARAPPRRTTRLPRYCWARRPRTAAGSSRPASWRSPRGAPRSPPPPAAAAKAPKASGSKPKPAAKAKTERTTLERSRRKPRRRQIRTPRRRRWTAF